GVAPDGRLRGRDEFERGLDEVLLLALAFDPVGANDLAGRRVAVHGHVRPAAAFSADGIALLELGHVGPYHWYLSMSWPSIGPVLHAGVSTHFSSSASKNC